MTIIRTVPEDKISHIVRVYARLQWPLSVDDADQVAHDLGWTRLPDPRYIHVVSDFQTSDTSTTFLSDEGLIKLIECYVCDTVDEGVDPALVKQAYKTIQAAVVSILGKPGEGRSQDCWWDLPTGGRIHVMNLERVVMLQVLSREYADIERGEARHGISPDRVLGEDE